MKDHTQTEGTYRLVVSIDVDASSLEDAYTQVYEHLSKQRSIDWESTNEAFDAYGEPVPPGELQAVRMRCRAARKAAKKAAEETKPGAIYKIWGSVERIDNHGTGDEEYYEASDFATILGAYREKSSAFEVLDAIERLMVLARAKEE